MATGAPSQRRLCCSSRCSHWLLASAAGLLYLAAFLTSVDAGHRTVPASRPWRPGVVPSLHEHVSWLQWLRLSHAAPPLLASMDVAALPPGLLPPSTSPTRIFHVSDYGADPTGRKDSADAISRAVTDAFQPPSPGRTLLGGIADLGGAEVHLDGGTYLVSRPIRLPSSDGGNLKIHSGSLVATNDFPADRYLIELWAASSSPGAESSTVTGPSAGLHYEYITLRDLMLDVNYRGGGIAVVDSLRTTIDNCYVSHFATNGILVRGGHETYIHNSYLGQHITAGADPGERNFTGVGIHLDGNDNAVTDVVIFSAATGGRVSGQANTLTGVHCSTKATGWGGVGIYIRPPGLTLTGVHCYNKATGWGGVGIYIRPPGLTQTRVVNCYLDYTSIVAEDPVQLLVLGCFFLGGGRVLLKSVKGVVQGVTIVDNVFSGSGGGGVGIVELDQSGGPFTAVEQVVVERNAVRGMAERATSARGSARGNGTSWAVDFAPVLLFPDRIDYVQYTLQVDDGTTGPALFPGHTLSRVAGNKVMVESQLPVPATVHVAVEQGLGMVAG